MSRWLEQHSAWRFFAIVWVAGTATTILVIAALSTWLLHRPLHLADVGRIAFLSLGGPMGATLGRRSRKARRRPR